jgi:hypothetical protein
MRHFTRADERPDALAACEQFTHEDIPDVTCGACDKIHTGTLLKIEPWALFDDAYSQLSQSLHAAKSQLRERIK